MTTTTINAPITLGDDFPYREAFLETLEYLCSRSAESDLKMVACWLTPKKQLRQYDAVERDLSRTLGGADSFCSFFEHLPNFFSDEFDEDVDVIPAVDFVKDDTYTACAKSLSRLDRVRNFGVEALAGIVLVNRPGDVTEDGKEEEG